MENDNAAVVGDSLETFIKAINNGSACSVLFLRMTGLFPAGRKKFRARDAVEYSNVFVSAGNNPGVL